MSLARTRTLLFLLALAAALIHTLGMGGKALWYDEIATAAYASKSMGDLWRFLWTHDAHPPLFFLLTPARLPIGAENALRLIPLVSSLACIPLAEWITRRLWGIRWWGAVLTAFAPGLVIYGQEARAYAPLVALEFASIVAVLSLRTGKTPVRDSALGALFLGLSVWMHYLAILFVLPVAAALIFWSPRKPVTLGFLVLAALAYLPWMPRTWATFFGDGAALQQAAPRVLGVGDYADFLSILLGTGWVAAIAVLSMIGVGWAFRKNAEFRLVLALFIFPLVFFAALPPRYPWFPPRYVITWGLLPILALPGLVALALERMRRVFTGVLLVVLAGFLWADLRHDLEKRDWNRDLAELSVELFKPGDTLIVDPYYQSLSILYYLPIAADEKQTLLEDPLSTYDGLQTVSGGKPVALTSFGALATLMSNRGALSGDLWLLAYGPLSPAIDALGSQLVPIRTWPQATLYRITSRVKMDPKSQLLFLGPNAIGRYHPAAPKKLP